jgi:hypothetical protein
MALTSELAPLRAVWAAHSAIPVSSEMKQTSRRDNGRSWNTLKSHNAEEKREGVTNGREWARVAAGSVVPIRVHS